MGTETENGRQRGRGMPPFPTFTFASTGRSVQIRRLSGDTMSAIRRAVRKDLPPPEPPLVDEPGPDGEPVSIPNRADPDYLAAKMVWEDQVQTECARRLQTLIETYALTSAIDAEEVAHYRDAMAAIGAPVDAERSDMAIYLWEICGPADTDKRDLIDFVLSRSQPTAEAVQVHAETFRHNVQGPPTA